MTFTPAEITLATSYTLTPIVFRGGSSPFRGPWPSARHASGPPSTDGHHQMRALAGAAGDF